MGGGEDEGVGGGQRWSARHLKGGGASGGGGGGGGGVDCRRRGLKGGGASSGGGGGGSIDPCGENAQEVYDTGVACNPGLARSPHPQCEDGSQCMYFDKNQNFDLMGFDNVGLSFLLILQAVTFDTCASEPPPTHTHTRTHALTHTRTHAHTHTRTHALTHTRTHAHTHSLNAPPSRLPPPPTLPTLDSLRAPRLQ